MVATTRSPDRTGTRRLALAWTLGLLTLVAIVNYMDRMALAVLLEPIRRDLRLSDTELGALSGVAFALFYATVGLYLGRVADRTHRVRLLSACLALWTLATGAGGLARGFLQLFLTRSAVGVGEAGCVPAAHSLIGDYMSPVRRPIGISLFSAGASVGLSVGLIGTGLIAEKIGWRGALLLIGACGLPISLLVSATLREPARRGASQGPVEPAGDAYRALFARPTVVHLLLANAIGAFGTYGLVQWLPTLYIRVFHMGVAQVGILAGAASAGATILGALAGAVLAPRLLVRDLRWELWMPAAGNLAAAPLFLALVLAPSPYVGVGFLGLGIFATAVTNGVALSALQSFAEPDRRATVVSLGLFATALIGLGLGPLTVGFLSDALAPALGAQALRYALLAPVVAILWGAAHFWVGARTAARDRV